MVKFSPTNTKDIRDYGSIPESEGFPRGRQSSILAWRILRTDKPGGYCPYGYKKSDTTEVT